MNTGYEFHGNSTIMGDSISLTFICNAPRVSASCLARILAATEGLLCGLCGVLLSREAAGWYISNVLFSYSEETTRQRIVIEFEGPPRQNKRDEHPPPANVYSQLSTLLESLRCGTALPTACSHVALAHIKTLAESLTGEIAEMWFSQAGITPVCITRDTLRNVSELLDGAN